MADTIQKARFDDDNLYSVFSSIIKIVTDANIKLPPYKSDTRLRDAALLNFVRSESLLSSILNYAVARQKAAPWLLSGPARQVGIYSRLIHGAHGKNWRTWISLQAMQYFATNFGFISELVVDGNGIVKQIYAVDSTRCKYTNSLQEPVVYYPRSGAQVKLNNEEIIYGNSLPAPEENLVYAGFCATERALNFARMSLAILNNHLESMGDLPPKGFLFAKAMRGEEFTKAIETHEENIKNNTIGDYNDLLAIFARNPDADMKMIPVSTLPQNFELTKYIESIVNGICAAYGVPIFNIWTVNSGSFGRGAEAQIANQEAARSGTLEFTSAVQEELSTKVFPLSVSFSFDLAGSAIKSIVNENRGEIIDQVSKLYSSGKKNQEGILTRDESRQLLAAENLIPYSWTPIEEDVTISDVQVAREIMRDNLGLREAAKVFHNEPIIQLVGNLDENAKIKVPRSSSELPYIFPPSSRVAVIWPTGDDMLAKRIF